MGEDVAGVFTAAPLYRFEDFIHHIPERRYTAADNIISLSYNDIFFFLLQTYNFFFNCAIAAKNIYK